LAAAIAFSKRKTTAFDAEAEPGPEQKALEAVAEG
jgi:hypothetical protein